MSTLERLWAYALLTGAAAMAVFTVVTWSRGWIRNEEEGEIVYRKDHPRSSLSCNCCRSRASPSCCSLDYARLMDGSESLPSRAILRLKILS